MFGIFYQLYAPLPLFEPIAANTISPRDYPSLWDKVINSWKYWKLKECLVLKYENQEFFDTILLGVIYPEGCLKSGMERGVISLLVLGMSLNKNPKLSSPQPKRKESQLSTSALRCFIEAISDLTTSFTIWEFVFVNISRDPQVAG